jgi:Resolvase, N terminal domain
MAGLKAGDVVVVTKLDRLGRSTRELLDLINRIGKAGASFRSLGDPLWDTSSAQGRLLSTLLASIAEFEPTGRVFSLNAGDMVASTFGEEIFIGVQSEIINDLSGSSDAVPIVLETHSAEGVIRGADGLIVARRSAVQSLI